MTPVLLVSAPDLYRAPSQPNTFHIKLPDNARITRAWILRIQHTALRGSDEGFSRKKCGLPFTTAMVQPPRPLTDFECTYCSPPRKGDSKLHLTAALPRASFEHLSACGGACSPHSRRCSPAGRQPPASRRAANDAATHLAGASAAACCLTGAKYGCCMASSAVRRSCTTQRSSRRLHSASPQVPRRTASGLGHLGLLQMSLHAMRPCKLQTRAN